MKKSDRGMTLIEVVIAMTLLLIVVGFIMKSDAVAHRYSYAGELRQQMIFYAAGLLEAQIENLGPVTDPPPDIKPFNNFQATITTTPSPENPHLEKVKVEVFLQNTSLNPEPVSLYTYRVKQ